MSDSIAECHNNLRTNGDDKRRVTFGNIEIIELPVEIGDGPAFGPPISVGWEAMARTEFNLEFFESYRPQRKPKQALRLNGQTRREL